MSRRHCQRVLWAVAGLALTMAVGACVTVGPADKQVLALPSMDFDKSRPGEAFVRHGFLTWEQADGGDGGEGGGCGCR